MKFRILTFSVAFAFTPCFFTACKTASKTTESSSIQDRMAFPREFLDRAKDSSIDIEYALGRSRYRLSAISRGEIVTLTTYLEKNVIKTGLVDSDQYPGFLKKASDFVGQTAKESPTTIIDDALCRNPFHIAVRIGQESRRSKGCRSADDGAISKLIKEGEFLLYSRK